MNRDRSSALIEQWHYTIWYDAIVDWQIHNGSQRFCNYLDGFLNYTHWDIVEAIDLFGSKRAMMIIFSFEWWNHTWNVSYISSFVDGLKKIDCRKDPDDKVFMQALEKFSNISSINIFL